MVMQHSLIGSDMMIVLVIISNVAEHIRTVVKNEVEQKNVIKNGRGSL